MYNNDLFEKQLHAIPADSPVGPPPASDYELSFMRRLLLAYTALAVYGSLFPWAALRWPESPVGALFVASLMSPQSASDVLFNLIIYIPLGLLMVRALGPMRADTAHLVCVGMAGMALSLTLESVQAFVPGRSCSLVDVGTNTIGAVAGAMLGTLERFSGEWGRRLAAWRRVHLERGPLATLGALVVCAWMVTQLSPFVPAPSISNLRNGLSPLWQALHGNGSLSTLQWLNYTFSIFAICIVARRVIKPSFPSWAIYLALGAVLALKVPILGRQLYPEALAGWLCGCALAALFYRKRPSLTLAASAALIAAACARLRLGSGDALHPMEWIPFKGQMASLSGVADVAGAAWPYLLVLFVVLLKRHKAMAKSTKNTPFRPRPLSTLLITGGGLITLYALVLELLQTNVPGRYPDVTDPVVAALAWLLPLAHPALRNSLFSPHSDSTDKTSATLDDSLSGEPLPSHHS